MSDTINNFDKTAANKAFAARLAKHPAGSAARQGILDDRLAEIARAYKSVSETFISGTVVVCDYCGSSIEMSAATCPACGARRFIAKVRG